MKTKKPASTQANKKGISWSFLILTLSHYVFGLLAIILSVKFATEHNASSQKLDGIFSIICVAIFAITQPDHKFRRVETGWRFLDEKLN